MKYCCNEYKNKDCPVNYKNAPKGAPIQIAAPLWLKTMHGLQAPVRRWRNHHEFFN